jgi:hypothetical protein
MLPRPVVRHLLPLSLLMLMMFPGYALADAIMRSNAMFATTIAEIYVGEDAILVDFEVGLNDLAAFENLLPDEIYAEIGNEPVPLVQRTPKFFAEDFLLIPDTGQPLTGRILSMGPEPRVTRDAVTGEALPVAEEDQEMVIRIRLAYELSDRPETLTIGLGPKARKTSIGYVAYHKSVAVNDFRFLTPAQTLKLDWQDPWYTAFTSRSLRRSYFAPMSGFIYVEPYEVRKEIIVRPKDLQHWIDLGLEGRNNIPVDMQEDIKQKVGAFLRDRQPVMIDGQNIEPELARVNFLARSLKTSMVIDPPRDLPIDSAVLGIIFVYPTVEPLPKNVTMTWDLFSEKIKLVPASAVDQAGALPTFLEPDYAVLEWQNFLKNPKLPTLLDIQSPPNAFEKAAVYLRWLFGLAAIYFFIQIARLQSRPRPGISAGLLIALIGMAFSFWLAGDAVMSKQRAEPIVAALLHNVYRAFDFRAEEDIYDVLDQSVNGDLLADIYLETRRGLELANQGGARAKVKSVELTDLEIEDGEDGGFVAASTWIVGGSVGHWGHIHARTNQYRARLDIEPVDGVWKLTGMIIEEEIRL